MAEGDTGYHLVAEGVWWETLASLAAGDQGFVLDSEVWNGYASKLFPRATGYSAGLIDYLFRTAVAADVYVDTCGEPQETFPFQMAIVPTAFFTDPINTTAVAERAGAGRVVAVARYTYGGQTHYFTLLDTVVSLHFDAECGCDVTDVTISSAPLAQVPQGAALEQDWTVVYRGPLGQETDAVIGGRGNFWGLSC